MSPICLWIQTAYQALSMWWDKHTLIYFSTRLWGGNKLHLQIHFLCAFSMPSSPFLRYFPFCDWLMFCLSIYFPKQQKLSLHELRPHLDKVEISTFWFSTLLKRVVFIGFLCQCHSPRRLGWCFLCLWGKYYFAFFSRSHHSSQTPLADLQGFLL